MVRCGQRQHAEAAGRCMGSSTALHSRRTRNGNSGWARTRFEGPAFQRWRALMVVSNAHAHTLKPSTTPATVHCSPHCLYPPPTLTSITGRATTALLAAPSISPATDTDTSPPLSTTDYAPTPAPRSSSTAHAARAQAPPPARHAMWVRSPPLRPHDGPGLPSCAQSN